MQRKQKDILVHGKKVSFVHVNLFRVIKRFLDQYDLLQKKAKWLVCVSGGVDSIVLFHLLNEFKKNHDINISMVHVDHQTRANSHKDATLCKHLAKQHNCPIYIRKINWKKNEKVSEQVMRDKRYKLINQVKKISRSDTVFLAHHLNDQVETFLMRMISSTHFISLNSIEEKRDHFYRPLLGVAKEDILKEAKGCHLKWREDQSNESDQFLRNRIRKECLPKMIRLNSSFLSNINEMARSIQAFKQYIQKEALTYLNKSLNKDKSLNVKNVLKAPEYLQGFILTQYFKDIHQVMVNQAQIQILLKKLSDQGHTGQLSGNCFYFIDKKRLLLKKRRIKN